MRAFVRNERLLRQDFGQQKSATRVCARPSGFLVLALLNSLLLSSPADAMIVPATIGGLSSTTAQGEQRRPAEPSGIPKDFAGG
jgi:hypothetical protein